MFPVFISSIADDDQRSFMEQLYLDHHASMKRTARKVLHHPEDAEDVVQIVCMALCKKVSLLKEMECNTLRSYIVISVKNTAINLIRSRDRRPELLWGESDYLDSLLGSQDPLEGNEFFNLEQIAMNQVVGQLPLRERNLLEMKYVLQYTDEEIAGDLGIKPVSVRVMLMRTRQKLRELLEETPDEG